MPTSPRNRILDAANQLFYAQGIHAVGVDTIMARAGAAKTSLYAHFGSKDALVAAYLRGRSEAWRSRLLDQLAQRTNDPRERLLAIFDILGEACSAPDYRGCPFINATAELIDAAHPGRAVVTEHRAWVNRLLRDLAAAAGCTDPATVAAELQLLYDAVLTTAQVQDGKECARRARAVAEAVIVLRQPRPRSSGVQVGADRSPMERTGPHASDYTR